MASRTTPGIALITGAASGIGKDAGFSFADSGARAVIFADRNEEGAQEAAELSKRYATNPEYAVLALRVEVTDEQSVQNMVDTAVEKFGRIDYFVHSAGVGSASTNPISSVSLSEFDAIIDINMRGTLLCNRSVLKVMETQEPRFFEGRHGKRDVGRGAIVNVGSMNSLAPLKGKVPYTASKHGVTAITKTGALECAPLSIRVNMICPTWVSTPMTDVTRSHVPHLDAMIKAAMPSGRMAAPDEVADVIVFLCSPAASYVTGQALVVDNGASLMAVRY